MAAKKTSSFSLFLVFFSLVSACSSDNPPKPPEKSSELSIPVITATGSCPRDALKLGVCVDVLGPLLGVTIGNPPTKPCCSVLFGLVNLEAAVCLCTAIKANILGINLDIPISLSLLLNVCGFKTPQGFLCENAPTILPSKN